MELLYGFFDTYLQLNEEEEKQVLKEIENLENLSEEEKEVVRHLPNSYYEMGMKEGQQEIIMKLLAKGMSISEIADVTELSKEKIKKLANQ